MMRRYWDSDVFLGWLNREPERHSICEAIIEDAKSGRCEIATSTITFAEVHYVRNSNESRAQIEAIEDLFDYSWVKAIDLDRIVARLARDLLFEFASTEGLKPPDAIHLASAMQARSLGRIEVFETWDGGLIHIGTQLHRISSDRGGTDIRVGNPTGQTLLLPLIADTTNE